MTRYSCDNCSWTGPAKDMNEVKDYWTRVDHRDDRTIIPDGECPDCGCLAYAMDDEDSDPAADRGDWQCHQERDQ